MIGGSRGGALGRGERNQGVLQYRDLLFVPEAESVRENKR